MSSKGNDASLDFTHMHRVTSYAAELQTFHCERVRKSGGVIQKSQNYF